MQLLKETLTEEKNTMNCFKVILMFKKHACLLCSRQ